MTVFFSKTEAEKNAPKGSWFLNRFLLNIPPEGRRCFPPLPPPPQEPPPPPPWTGRGATPLRERPPCGCKLRGGADGGEARQQQPTFITQQFLPLPPRHPPWGRTGARDGQQQGKGSDQQRAVTTPAPPPPPGACTSAIVLPLRGEGGLGDRKSTRLKPMHSSLSRIPAFALKKKNISLTPQQLPHILTKPKL